MRKEKHQVEWNKNAEAVALDAKNIGRINFSRPLHVITDPPRTGMEPKAVQQLLKLGPETITYISCNPRQLKKEMLKFSKYYTIKSVALFDMFPQTNHMEIVVEMVNGH